MPSPGSDARCRFRCRYRGRFPGAGRGRCRWRQVRARAGPGRWRGAGPRGRCRCRCPRGAERCRRRCAMAGAGAGTGARRALLALCVAVAAAVGLCRVGERLHVCKEVPGGLPGAGKGAGGCRYCRDGAERRTPRDAVRGYRRAPRAAESVGPCPGSAAPAGGPGGGLRCVPSPRPPPRAPAGQRLTVTAAGTVRRALGWGMAAGGLGVRPSPPLCPPRGSPALPGAVGSVGGSGTRVPSPRAFPSLAQSAARLLSHWGGTERPARESRGLKGGGGGHGALPGGSPSSPTPSLTARIGPCLPANPGTLRVFSCPTPCVSPAPLFPPPPRALRPLFIWAIKIFIYYLFFFP